MDSRRIAKERESIAYTALPLNDPTPFDSICAIPYSDSPLKAASSPVPPSYNDVSGPVVIDQDGKPQFLTPEQEVERQHRLETAVREKMLGLPRTVTFEWHQGPSSSVSEELQLPPYTPKEEKK